MKNKLVLTIVLIAGVCVTFAMFAQMPCETLSAGQVATRHSVRPNLLADLIVLVIADHNAVYSINWAVWHRLKFDHPNIQVYFLIGNQNFLQTTIMEYNNTISVPVNETIVPGVLVKTIEALQVLLKDKSRTFKFVLRTNMSSMWHWGRLFALLQNMTAVGTYAGVLGGGGFVSGAGMLLSRDVVEKLVNNKDKLDWALFDDVAIGNLLRTLSVETQEMNRCDYVSNAMPYPLDKGGCHHFRIKNQNRYMHDHYIFSRLYFELYPNITDRPRTR